MATTISAELCNPNGADGAENTWREQAACKGRTSLFFPRRAERPEARARREARAGALCAVCPVLGACREHARAHHEYGYWGGESEETRHLLGYTVSAPIGLRSRATDHAV
jgi:WhiB family redox-sensing transcriptional regulator